MTVARFALYCAAFFLLCLLGAGFYGYRHLPALAEQQAEIYLREYGVQDIDFEALQFSDHQFSTDKLWLRGELNGLAFEATLTSLEVNYHWRMLLDGKLQSVTLGKLNLVVEETSPSADTASGPVSVDSLLPQPLIAELPLQSLAIQQWHLNYQSRELPPISAMGHLLVTDKLSLHLETAHLDSHITADIWTGAGATVLGARVLLQDGETDVTRLTAALERVAADDWQWTVQGRLDYAPVLAWLRRLDLETDLQLDTSAIADLNLLGDSEFSATINHPDTLLIAPAADPPLPAQFSAQISVANTIAQLDYAGVVEGITGQLHTALELDAGQLHLTLAPTELTGSIQAQQLSLPEDTQRWLRWDKTVPVRWKNPEPMIITLTADNSGVLQLRDTLLVIGGTDSELWWEGINLEVLFQPAGQAQLSTKLNARIKTRLRKQQLPQMELAFTQQGSLEDSEFSLRLDDTAESFRLGLRGDVNLGTGGGQYNLDIHSLDLPYAASTVLPLLQKFGLLQQSVEISNGNISLNSELKSQDFNAATLQQQSQLIVQNLSGSFDEYRFEGMALTAHWSGIEQWKTQRPVEFTMAKLNAGFDVVDIQAQFGLPQPTPIAQPVVRIEKFSAGMFGGRVYLPEPRRWDFGADTNKFTLRAEKWQLADMVALQQSQDIQALGVLEGELPMTMTAGRIIIEKGYLRALPPGGSIRYIANEASLALTASSPELGLALDLLSDFQYEVLSSEVELDKDGNLLLGLSLSGKNPAQYEGRPINFNINLEQNLDPLLQSLRLSDKLVEKIESRLH